MPECCEHLTTGRKILCNGCGVEHNECCGMVWCCEVWGEGLFAGQYYETRNFNCCDYTEVLIDGQWKPAARATHCDSSGRRNTKTS